MSGSASGNANVNNVNNNGNLNNNNVNNTSGAVRPVISSKEQQKVKLITK
ncbi:MAG: hypothetical protein L6V91_03625 [Bacilli bacterium]|nr:MAG: hypothetical protein L6V91_03625 [Bacilli bacterium]